MNEYYYVDDDGNIVYVGDTESDSDTSSDVSDDGSDDADVEETEDGEVVDASELEDLLSSVSDYLDDVDTSSMSYDDLVSAVADGITTAEGAAGTLSSSTLEVFDRIVSGLSSDYGYVAFRTDSDDSTAGILIYGKVYDVDGTVISIDDEDTESIAVYRSRETSSSSYITYVDYDAGYTITDADLSEDASIIYYTNLVDGYPVLGGYSSTTSFPYGAVLSCGIVFALASVVLRKLFSRFRS